jgi:hypothetical protein
MSNGIKDLTSRADTALDKATDYSNSLLALGVALNPATSFGQDVFDIGLGGINILRSLLKGKGVPGEEVARSGFGILGLLPIISGLATRRGRQALSDLQKYGPIEKGKSGGRPRKKFPEKYDKPDPSGRDVTGKIPLTKRDYEHWGYPKTKIEEPELLTPQLRKMMKESEDLGLGPKELNPLRAQQEKEDLVAAWLRDDKRKEIETALGWQWLPDGNEFMNLKTGARQKNIPRELRNHPEWRAIREGFVEDKNKIERAVEEGGRRGAIQSETIKEGSYFGQRQIDKAKEAEARIEKEIKENIIKEEKAVSFMTDPDMRAGSPGSYEVELPASERQTLPGYMRKFFVKGGVGVDTRINRQLLPNQSFIERLKANPNLTPEQKIKIFNDEADYILKNHGEEYHKIFTEGVPERKTLLGQSHFARMMGSMKGRKLLPSEYDSLVEAANADPQNLNKLQQRLVRGIRDKVREERGLEPLPFVKKEKVDWAKESKIEAEQQERILDEALEGKSRGFMEEKPVAPRQVVKNILEGLEDLPSTGIMRVGRKGVQVIPPKVHSKVMPMNYKDGQYGLNMQPQFKGKSTMDLIKSGDRTGTSRGSINKDYNVGDLVEVKGSGKEKILVRIEAHDDGSVWKKVSDINPEEWMAREGWDLDAYNKLARAGNYQMKYSVARLAKTGQFQNYNIDSVQKGLSKMYTELGFNKPRIRQIPQGSLSRTGRVQPELLEVVREAIPFTEFLERFQKLPPSEQIKYLSKYLEEGRTAKKVARRRKVREAIRPSPRGEATAIKTIEKRKAKEKSEGIRQEALEMERRRKLFEGKSLRERVALAMAESGNDVDKAATLLGWNNRYVKDWIKRYGLKFESKP